MGTLLMFKKAEMEYNLCLLSRPLNELLETIVSDAVNGVTFNGVGENPAAGEKHQPAGTGGTFSIALPEPSAPPLPAKGSTNVMCTDGKGPGYRRRLDNTME